MWGLALIACGHPPVEVAPASRPGTLTIAQLDLRGATGESVLVVGPDGTVVLIDVGNDSHGGRVTDAVVAATGAAHADVIVLTHHHEDHEGGLDDLGLSVDVVLNRGLAHPQRDTNEGVRDSLRGRAGLVDLCDATGCPSLPFRVALGQGAALEVFAADATIGGETLPGVDDSEENALSLVGVVSWGDFDYGFAGDLCGGGKRTPDVEAFVAARVDPWLPASGVDVLHLGHHGIDSSTHAAWIDRMLPDDGALRHAVVGTNGTYLDAPADEVLDRLRDRLGGGRVWVPTPGALTGDDPLLEDVGGPVTITVAADGRYAVGDAAAVAIP